MKDKLIIPIRVFDCGHKRAEDVANQLVNMGYKNVRFQKKGEMGYCRICLQDKVIVDVE